MEILVHDTQSIGKNVYGVEGIIIYKTCKRGKPIGEIMGEIAEQVQKTYEIEKLIKKNHMEDFQCMKPYLRISLINTGRNRQRLLHMPHREIEDLSMVCRVDIPSPEGNGRSDWAWLYGHHPCKRCVHDSGGRRKSFTAGA